MPFALGQKGKTVIADTYIHLLLLHKVTGARMAIQYMHAYGLCGTINRTTLTDKITDNENLPLEKNFAVY